MTNYFNVFMIKYILPIFFMSWSLSAYPCSVFSFQQKKDVFVGKNFDWDWDHGLIMVNQRGLKKQALISAPNVPAKWTSKYGSVTFNQVGDGFPYGGMNEKGLTIEVLNLSNAQFPAANSLPAVTELQWVQYQLDNYATVKEVVDNINSINTIRSLGSIHYFVCDSQNQCAAIEPLSGKFIVHTKKTLPIAALTNNTYEESIQYAKQFSSQNPPKGTKSLDRFANLKYLLSNNLTQQETAVEKSFIYLNNVMSLETNKDDDKTQWQTTYNLTQKKIYFKSARSDKIKSINFNKIDFSCAHKRKILDVNIDSNGDVTNLFSDYTSQDNEKIIQLSLKMNDGSNIPLPKDVFDKMSNYSNSFVCSPT